jgi:hypothetical protein
MFVFIVLALVFAFVCAATVGHILLGAALLWESDAMSENGDEASLRGPLTRPAGAANDRQPQSSELAA